MEASTSKEQTLLITYSIVGEDANDGARARADVGVAHVLQQERIHCHLRRTHDATR